MAKGKYSYKKSLEMDYIGYLPFCDTFYNCIVTGPFQKTLKNDKSLLNCTAF